MSHIKKILGWALLLLFISQPLHGQTYGKIAGTVVDAQTGEPLIGANVYLQNAPLGGSTDADGAFVILRIQPGKYTVIAEYVGYARLVLNEVEVLTDLTTPLEVRLTSATFEGEEIVVVAEAPVIRKDLTSVEARVQSEEIERMAVTDVGDLISMQAGVTKDAGGGIHIRGGRSTEVAYMINGVSVTDGFSRAQAVQVENESVQELQLISGTFNAEYGNAMSGIVNIVTKTGDEKYRASVNTWAGDYISSRKKLFFNIDDVDPLAVNNIQATVSGPIIPGKAHFFATVNRRRDDGYLYGAEVYKPQPTLDKNSGALLPTKSDSGAVAMNWNERLSTQLTTDWLILPTLKLKTDLFAHKSEGKGYNHFYKTNPNGYKGGEETGYNVIAKLTHTFSNTTFHELTASYRYTEQLSKLYDRFDDPRYVRSDVFIVESNHFSVGGTELNRYNRKNKSAIVKYDLTSQITKRHLVKTGVEAQFDEVFSNSEIVEFEKDENGIYKPFIHPITQPEHDRITRKPLRFATYIQDKIEYESLIINLGLRFEYFDAQGHVPKNLNDPNIHNPLNLLNLYRDLNGDGIIGKDEEVESNKYTLAEREKFWYKKTTAKTQISPRLGLAFPITERGVLHFSYGIFQQIPEYSRLYQRDEIKIGLQGGTHGVFGNPDLKPQTTTSYEFGLQQQFTDNLSMDATGFYRDIRNWVSTGQPYSTPISDISWVRFNNRDFANVRGITLTVKRRFADGWAFNLDYTFQIAEGTNSDPEAEFFAQSGGAEPTKALTPLNWDQRHTLNGNVFIGGDDWGANLIGELKSGQPYTPSSTTAKSDGSLVASNLPQNSRVKPVTFNMDLNLFKNFVWNDFKIQLYAKVFNLFDSDNPHSVYSDTGLADFTLQRFISSHDATWYRNPGFYARPRQVTIGTKIDFN